MTKHIHIYLPARRTADAGAFKEGDHPRKEDGKFGSGGGGGGKAAPSASKPAAKYTGSKPDHIKSVSAANGKAVVTTNSGARHEIAASSTGGKMPRVGEHVGEYTKPDAKAISLREVMADPKHRESVESIEEMEKALEDKGGKDPHLASMIEGAKSRLKTATGYQHGATGNPMTASAKEPSDADLAKHSQHTKADLAYLKGKGWSNSQVAKRWDEEASAGLPAQRVNKHNPPSVTG